MSNPDFDWVGYFESAGVPYIVGPARNVGSGNIGIPCPRCPSDEGFHFGLSLTSGATLGCWKSESHWVSPVTLISEISNISLSQAIEVYDEGPVPTEDVLASLLVSLEDSDSSVSDEVGVVSFPHGSRRIDKDYGLYRDYMEARGFDVDDLGSYYKVYVGPHRGVWSGRVLFPIIAQSNLVGWTGRSVTNSYLRYRAYPTGSSLSGVPLIPRNVAKGGKALIVVEGPADAYKVDQLGRALGRRSVGLMGCKMQPSKSLAISDLARKFDRVVVLLDRGKTAEAMSIAEGIFHPHVLVMECPPGYEDPGEFDADALGFIKKL